jgi:hypothetical protein
MMLKPVVGTVKNNSVDFRNELAIKNFPGKIVYNIYVSSKTKNQIKLSLWDRIGTMTLTKSIVSYGCDRRLHFAHPKFLDIKCQ